MLRFWLHGTAFSALIFCALLGAIHTQPYDDGGLRAGLFSSACTPPCFLGIRPGVTTRDESLALLQAHPWVASVRPIYSEQGFASTWNGSQPAFLRGGRFENHLLLRDGVVSRINLFTWINPATFMILLGTPDAIYYASYNTHDDITNTYVEGYQQNALYGGAQMEVQMAAFCPLSIYEQWLQPTVISLPAPSNHVGYADTEQRGALLRQECQ